jgi:hypothetical protein
VRLLAGNLLRQKHSSILIFVETVWYILQNRKTLYLVTKNSVPFWLSGKRWEQGSVTAVWLMYFGDLCWKKVVVF